MVRRNRKGFTLMELLIVMAIIAILAGLVMTASFIAKRQAMITKARAAISNLETALGMFQSNIGEYPASGNANLVTCLTTSGNCLVGTGVPMTPAQVSAWSGSYTHFQANEINTNGELIDPWNNPYTYNNPGTNHGTAADYSDYVDIWSNGPDGADQHTSIPPGDDVTNWTK